MLRPSDEVSPVVLKTGAGTTYALTESRFRGIGPATKPIETRAVISTRRERELMVFNT